MPKKRNYSRLYKSQVDSRERRLVALARYRAEGRKLTDYATDVGITLRTALRDQALYKKRLCMATETEIGFERSRVLHELNDLKIDLHNPDIDPDRKVALALAIIDREVDLLGLNAPTKSITAHIDADGTGRFHRFIQAAAGLSDEQLEQVLQFAVSIERKPLELPPGPPPLALTEGE